MYKFNLHLTTMVVTILQRKKRSSRLLGIFNCIATIQCIKTLVRKTDIFSEMTEILSKNETEESPAVTVLFFPFARWPPLWL